MSADIQAAAAARREVTMTAIALAHAELSRPGVSLPALAFFLDVLADVGGDLNRFAYARSRPTIEALQRVVRASEELQAACEAYAVAAGLDGNDGAGELIPFRPGA